jgi:hypothetical protein
MGDLCRLIWYFVAGLFRSRAALQAEILVLRHQLNVLRRKWPKRSVFNNIDRLVFATLCGLAPNMLDALKILNPETVVRWHRAGFRAYWRWKSRPRGGRPRASAEVRDLIREMSIANPLWGAPRIHGELLKIGIEVGDHRGKIHGETKIAAVARLENLSSQSCRWHCIDRHVRRADYLVSIAIQVFDPAARSPRAPMVGRDSASECFLDRTAIDRSIRVEGDTAVSHSRPGFCLRRDLHSAHKGDGHTRHADGAPVAMAKRICGEDDRHDPTGLS